MSKIELTYIEHMQSLCFYRFSSSFITLMMYQLMIQPTKNHLFINNDISADDNNEEKSEDEDTESSKISTFLCMRLDLIRSSHAMISIC